MDGCTLPYGHAYPQGRLPRFSWRTRHLFTYNPVNVDQAYDLRERRDSNLSISFVADHPSSETPRNTGWFVAVRKGGYITSMGAKRKGYQSGWSLGA